MTPINSSAITFAQNNSPFSHTFSTELIKEAVKQARHIGNGRILDHTEFQLRLIDWSKQVISPWSSE